MLASLQSFAQSPNLYNYDFEKKIHFGFTVAANIGRLQVVTRPDVFKTDSINSVSVTTSPGLGLGAITNWHLGDNFDLRLMAPVISFVQRNLVYELASVKKTVKVESAYCDASLLIKYKSERRRNVRFYVVAGPRFSYDFSSTINKTRGFDNPVVSLNPMTFGWEAGFGFDFYFEYFKFSPELKSCQTWSNALYQDGFLYTTALEAIYPQLIQISLHFE